ncbi:MAG: hypothetical protein SXQ77_13035, partial [Halobacteria archaeon]|nr:hypothetical protein [Halobacteria archaeon]
EAEHESSESSYYLVPASDHSLATRVPEVKKNDAGVWRIKEKIECVPRSVKLDVNRYIQEKFYLVTDHSTENIPIGDYSFSSGDHLSSENVVISVWDASSPGPQKPSELKDIAVPDLPDSGNTNWYHNSDETTEVYLHPEEEILTFPNEIEISLINHSNNQIRKRGTSVNKLHEGNWFTIETSANTLETPPPIYPGEHESWKWGCKNNCQTKYGNGLYAILSDAGDQNYAALIRIKGSSIKIKPDPGLKREEDGGSLIVTSPKYTENSDGSGKLSIQQIEEEGEQIIAEQIVRIQSLKNTIPFLDSYNKVVYRSSRREIQEINRYTKLRKMDWPKKVRYGNTSYKISTSRRST